MNHPSLLLLLALGCVPAIAAPTAEVPPASGAAPSAETASLTPAQLDELLAPIALYPDPLVAIILPASTFPADVVLAARHVAAGGKPETFETQSWDDSVKAIARYPEVLKWMDENLEWTRVVGAAFLRQPAEVLTSTQRLRSAARAAGNLASTPEQTVVVEREIIRIVPARPEVIFVPVYDASWIYRPRVVNVYHPGPLIGFSTGYRTGAWLSYHCNWSYKTLVVVARPHRVTVWRNHPRWVCPSPAAGYDHHVWRPSAVHMRSAYRENGYRVQERVPRPAANAHLLREPAQSAPAPAHRAQALPAANPSNPAITRPGGLADSSRRGPASAGTGTATASPSGGERGRDNRQAQILARPSAQRIMPAPAPSPSPSPTTSLTPPAPTPSRRVHSVTTQSSGGTASGFRSRPSPAPATTNRTSISAPSRQSPPPAITPRRERENRQISVPAAIQQPAPRRSTGAAQTTTMPRRGSSAAMPPSGVPAEAAESAASRRGR